MNAKAKKDAAKTDSKTDDLGLPQGDAGGESTPPSGGTDNADERGRLMDQADAIIKAHDAEPEPSFLLHPTLRVKRLHPDAQLPRYQSAGASCFDLHSVDGDVIAGKSAKTFGTGLAFEVPDGFVMMVFSRSGDGFNRDVRLANCVGIIDSDYRGEVKVRMSNDHRADTVVNEGERIAQALLVQVDQWQIEEVEELSATARGVNGLGSTGA